MGFLDLATVATWAPATGEILSRFEHPRLGGVRHGLAGEPSLATGCFDGTGRGSGTSPCRWLGHLRAATKAGHRSPFDAAGAVVVATDAKASEAAVLTRTTRKPVPLPSLGSSAHYESSTSRRTDAGHRGVSDQTVRILDAERGKPVATLGDAGGRVLKAVFGPDENHVRPDANGRRGDLEHRYG